MSILKYKLTTCKNCGIVFEQLITRNDKLCVDCRPKKRG